MIDDRKAPGFDSPEPAAEYRIRTFGLARAFLRSDGTRQAGFNAELLERFAGRANAPVLYQDGELHREQRASTARFFAPKIVATRYRQLMEDYSDEIIERFRDAGAANLDDLSLEMSVAVAAEIVGLTDSNRRGMARRLNRFFATTAPARNRFSAFIQFVLGQSRLLAFYLGDVQPAISSRRRQRKDDLVSHLLDKNRSSREILTECLTYAAAGMATTREFIVMAAWHLFDNEPLRQRFQTTDEADRVSILEDILRLEPVIGALYRKTTSALRIEADGETLTLPANARVMVDVRAINADRAVGGACPFHIDPDRKPSLGKTHPSGISFGDGPHRCPGAAVALQETAIFLHRLLAIQGIRLTRLPDVRWNSLIASYELRGARVSIDDASRS